MAVQKKFFDDPIVKYSVLIGGVVVVGSMLGAFKGLLELLGLKDTQDTKDLDATSQSAGNFWSPTFYQQAPSGSLLLTMAAAEEYSRQIYNAVGPFNDDEEAVIGVFKKLKTQSQVSFLADVFSTKYQSDLLSFIRGGNWPQDRLSDADVNTINKYILSLPKYKL